MFIFENILGYNDKNSSLFSQFFSVREIGRKGGTGESN